MARGPINFRPGPSRKSEAQAGADAGMSERQIKTAVRVANVSVEDFEAAVESDAPPTVTHNTQRKEV